MFSTVKIHEGKRAELLDSLDQDSRLADMDTFMHLSLVFENTFGHE